MEFLLANWGVCVSIVSAICVLAINNYKTKKNISDTEKNTLEIEKVKESINDLVSWTKARETFVSKELFESHIGHIDGSLNEIKQQNQQILEKLISK